MKKVIKIISHILLTVLFIGYIAYQFRTDPIAMISGKQLSGEEVAYPSDWTFTNDYETVAVESRPGNPHSVTTICIVHGGDLFIPASNGSKKTWTQYVLDNPRARIKVGEVVYPVKLTRVTDIDTASFRDDFAAKYPRYASSDDQQEVPDLWLFRVSERGGS